MRAVPRSAAIYPVQVKPASTTATWTDWPEDVRATLRVWVHDGSLAFIWLGQGAPPVFKCWDCGLFCTTYGNSAALAGLYEWICDECLVRRIRLSDTGG